MTTQCSAKFTVAKGSSEQPLNPKNGLPREVAMAHILSRLFGCSALALALTGTVAWAQDKPASYPSDTKEQSKMHDMKGMDMDNMNMHTMSATVDAVDHQTGIVDVTSSGMKL